METRPIGPLIDAGQSHAAMLRYSSPDPTKAEAVSKDHYQTLGEASDRLKVFGTAVRPWISKSQLRANDVGKDWRIADAGLAKLRLIHPTAPKLRRPGRNGHVLDGEAQCST